MKSLCRVTITTVIGASLFALPVARAGISEATTPPNCIISLSPSATETLFALGVGREVKAVDATANFPRRGLPAKRIDAFNPSLESILTVCPAKPTLVVISYDANQIQEQLRAQGVAVLDQPAPSSLTAAYQQIISLGNHVQRVHRAHSVVAKMKRAITAAISSGPRNATSQRVYYELDPTFYSVTSSSFVGSILKLMHVTNIADAKGVENSGGYPQLSAEYIASVNPTIIFLADTICCKASFASVAQRVAFHSVYAVHKHQVFGLDDDVASRWGPRLINLVRTLASDINRSLRSQR